MGGTKKEKMEAKRETGGWVASYGRGSSLPGSIGAGQKGVREARHVLAGVKSIPVKERKTREKRPLVSRSVIISIWVDRSIGRKGANRRERIAPRLIVNHSFVRRTVKAYYYFPGNRASSTTAR